jgi:50S ribosomal subunit-associated GTPase HflX
VFNKIDLVTDRFLINDAEAEYPNCVFVSAERGLNMMRLLQRMQETYDESAILRVLEIPYEDMRIVNKMYEDLEVLSRHDGDHAIRLSVRVPSDKLPLFNSRYGQYTVIAEPPLSQS